MPHFVTSSRISVLPDYAPLHVRLLSFAPAEFSCACVLLRYVARRLASDNPAICVTRQGRGQSPSLVHVPPSDLRVPTACLFLLSLHFQACPISTVQRHAFDLHSRDRPRQRATDLSPIMRLLRITYHRKCAANMPSQIRYRGPEGDRTAEVCPRTRSTPR